MEIESGVEIPDRTRSEAGKAARKMKVNDSLHCESLAQMETVRATIRRLGGKAATRKMDRGWRVWRVA